MAKYRCIKRLTTDNHKTVHEVGEVVELSDKDAKVALQARAVVVAEDEPAKVPAKAADKSKGDA